jgi:hypothetical protein
MHYDKEKLISFWQWVIVGGGSIDVAINATKVMDSYLEYSTIWFNKVCYCYEYSMK